MTSGHRRTLELYFIFSYGLVLLNLLPLLRWAGLGAMARVFEVMAALSYPALYLIPALLVTLLVARLWRARAAAIAVSAVVMVSLVQIFLFADRIVFSMFDFHLNGFVWNLVMTRGGLASMGASPASSATFAAMASLLVVMQAGAWWTARRLT